jgi:hypothetical protein
MNFEQDDSTPKSGKGKTATVSNKLGGALKSNETAATPPTSNSYSDYYGQYQQQFSPGNYTDSKTTAAAAADAYYKYYGQNQQENEISGSSSGGFFSAFGTPVVRT